jgi:hypothetical protein
MCLQVQKVLQDRQGEGQSVAKDAAQGDWTGRAQRSGSAGHRIAPEEETGRGYQRGSDRVFGGSGNMMELSSGTRVVSLTSHPYTLI